MVLSSSLGGVTPDSKYDTWEPITNLPDSEKLNDYTRVQQVTLDTDPLMWLKQHVQEFPRLVLLTRKYLTVPATSMSPERLFISLGLVKSDFRGNLLDTTLIDMWVKQAPRTQLEREQEK
jgi:hypothetical protein